MPLPINMTTLSSLYTHMGHKRVAQAVMVLLLIYIAHVAADITWSTVPQAQFINSNATNQQQRSNSKNDKSIDIAKIESLNLFGEYDDTGVDNSLVEAEDVPETELKLTLSGLVASDSRSTAAAIIENGGKQETYGIGDTIIGTRAELEKVLMDRVLINVSGRLETLMLDGFDYNQPARQVANQNKPKPNKGPAPSTSDVVDKRNNEALSNAVKNLRNEISDDPSKIEDYLRIAPKRKNGEIIGYSLRPGKQPEFFTDVGLKSGDVAVQMNGYDLIEPMQAMQAMTEMKEASDISLLVDREGNLTEILISLN